MMLLKVALSLTVSLKACARSCFFSQQWHQRDLLLDCVSMVLCFWPNIRNVDKITADGCKIKILGIEILSVQLSRELLTSVPRQAAYGSLRSLGSLLVSTCRVTSVLPVTEPCQGLMSPRGLAH